MRMVYAYYALFVFPVWKTPVFCSIFEKAAKEYPVIRNCCAVHTHEIHKVCAGFSHDIAVRIWCAGYAPFLRMIIVVRMRCAWYAQYMRICNMTVVHRSFSLNLCIPCASYAHGYIGLTGLRKLCAYHTHDWSMECALNMHEMRIKYAGESDPVSPVHAMHNYRSTLVAAHPELRR